jgi:hypothetical protein
MTLELYKLNLGTILANLFREHISPKLFAVLLAGTPATIAGAHNKNT